MDPTQNTSIDRSTRRILIVEKMIMMPVKMALLLFSFLFFWAPEQEFKLLTKKFFFYQSMLYIVVNIIFYMLISWAQFISRRFKLIKISAFLLTIIDSLYLSFLIPLTGGLESPVYWIYSSMMVRNAVNFPRIRIQWLINLALCIFYGSAVYYSERESTLFLKEIFYLRIIVLCLVSVCCWGIYALIRQKMMQIEEERELRLMNEKIHAIRRLAGEIAHGLKNPLNIINNAAYYVGKHIADQPKELRQQVAIIREEVERSNRILSQIMNYSKLSTAKISKLDVNVVLRQAIQEIHSETLFPSVKIEMKLQEKLPPIFFDEGHLKQIFSNLILNGAEAILDGQETGLITVTTDLDRNEKLLVTIADNGRGIEERYVDKIFEPFFTTKPAGTGLGLSIVKNIVETYDGNIQVSSDEGKGTIFTIRLPVWSRLQGNL